MVRTSAKLLLALAACVGMLPSGNCLFMMMGECCQSSGVVKNECHSHDHAPANHESDAPHSADSVPSSENKHHTSCLVVSTESISAQTQRAPKPDLHHDIAPIIFIASCLTLDVAEADRFEARSARFHPSPPGSPLYVLTHSYLI